VSILIDSEQKLSTRQQGSMVSNIARTASASRVRPLQTAHGGYAMLALDQRESLRTMFGRDASGDYVGDDVLKEFKAVGVEVLSSHASAVLLDRPFGLANGRPAGLAPDCALIVAVDVLHQLPGHDITDVSVDEQVTAGFLRDVGAQAIKLLVLWRRDSGRDERAELVNRVVELAREAGVASLVEGIVRPALGTRWADHDERHAAILDCARELVGYDPDIYKAEVPGYVQGDLSRVTEQSERMSEIVGRDWVILSNGVEKGAFADALTAARAGGAQGFLAGRAVWADTVNEPDRRAALEDRSVARLQQLTDIVAASQ
jgi:sulfofructosephosphate aldolase